MLIYSNISCLMKIHVVSYLMIFYFKLQYSCQHLNPLSPTTYTAPVSGHNLPKSGRAVLSPFPPPNKSWWLASATSSSSVVYRTTNLCPRYVCVCNKLLHHNDFSPSLSLSLFLVHPHTHTRKHNAQSRRQCSQAGRLLCLCWNNKIQCSDFCVVRGLCPRGLGGRRW